MDALQMHEGAFSDWLVEAAVDKRIPISGAFELLPNCNMSCKMCYIQHTPRITELKPVEFWLSVIDQSIEKGMLFPLLTGGEPLLYPGFHELYERIMKRPVYLAINTNATLLNRETVKWMAKSPPRRLNISLYGASDDTYAKLCRNPKGFTQVTQAFELLKEYGIQFRVHSSMVPDNISDQQAMREICNYYKVPLTMVHYMFPAYRKEVSQECEQMRFTPKEMAKASLDYFKARYKDKIQEYCRSVIMSCQAFEKPEVYSLYNDNEVNCKGGKCTFWVDWHGRMSSCGVHNQSAVDLSQATFADAWKRIVEDTDKLYLPIKCKTCPYRCVCVVCPAACFCETGSMNKAPEYLCEYSRAYAELLKEERKLIIEKE